MILTVNTIIFTLKLEWDAYLFIIFYEANPQGLYFVRTGHSEIRSA